MPNNRLFFILGAVALMLLGIAAGSAFEKMRANPSLTSPTVKDLPAGVEYVRHPNEEAQAQEAGKTVMLHYATPDAERAGGPVYGVMGYRIVSVEYEIPLDKIPAKTVGEKFAGYLLNLPEVKDLHYDHFHISYQPEGLSHAEEGDMAGQGVYSIHFMLISHEEELRYGLVCE